MQRHPDDEPLDLEPEDTEANPDPEDTSDDDAQDDPRCDFCGGVATCTYLDDDDLAWFGCASCEPILREILDLPPAAPATAA